MSDDSTGLTPLPDMAASDEYKGEDGGLYGGGRNTPPEALQQAAMAAAKSIQPLDADGNPSPKTARIQPTPAGRRQPGCCYNSSRPIRRRKAGFSARVTNELQHV